MRPFAELSDALEAGVDPDTLVVAYEPIVDLLTGEVMGAEALLRRRMPTGVLQIAARFLPLTEASGLIVEIGRRVIDEACEQAATWQSARRGAFVAVNVSARQLEDPGLTEWVQAVLARHALPAECLVIDIPERTVAEAAATPGPMLARIRELGRLGVRIAVDDVGTGPAYPNYISVVPAAMLKLDGRFVRALRGQGASQLAQAVVTLAHELGIVAVAEGVEGDEEGGILRGMGCDLAQGYAVGHATTGEEIKSYLRG